MEGNVLARCLCWRVIDSSKEHAGGYRTASPHLPYTYRRRAGQGPDGADAAGEEPRQGAGAEHAEQAQAERVPPGAAGAGVADGAGKRPRGRAGAEPALHGHPGGRCGCAHHAEQEEGQGHAAHAGHPRPPGQGRAGALRGGGASAHSSNEPRSGVSGINSCRGLSTTQW